MPADYLLYGRLYIPTGRLDALYSTRLTPSLQAMVAAISDPRSPLSSEKSRGHAPSSNVMFSLQQDTGKWCNEYTWSADDGMWGVRTLYNFGKLGNHTEVAEEGERTAASSSAHPSKPKRVDEEDAMEGGLKGRISVGGEFYFSAKERSAGGVSCRLLPSRRVTNVFSVSTGIRFTTLPDATPPSFQVPSSSGTNPPPFPSQPPTTITALFNPMLGHMSGSYAARISRDLSLASRFDFNVYSYESEWSVGAEWWTRRSKGRPAHPPAEKPISTLPMEPSEEALGVVKAKLSTTTVRRPYSFPE